METTNQQLLEGYSEREKVAYLAAIASIATADRSAGEEESEFLQNLSEASGVSEDGMQQVVEAAQDETGNTLPQHLDVLKTSELRFSLMADLIAFAESDQNYSEEERRNIQKIGNYLNVNEQQVSAINQFVDKTSGQEIDPQQMQSQGFLGSLGLGDTFQKAGLNSSSLMKGLIGIAGPLILSSLLSRGRGGSGGGIGGMLGGMLGGGGLGGMLGGGRSGGGGLGGMLGGSTGGGGGLGSLIGMLSGGRGIGSTGGLFGKILGGR